MCPGIGVSLVSVSLGSMIVAVLVSAGCGPVLVGGRYAVHAYDLPTGNRASPRVVIGFYDHALPRAQMKVRWGVAVKAEAAETGIAYPAQCYWDWGMVGYGRWTGYVFPAVCVLAEGYWPSIMSTNLGPIVADVPFARHPNLFEKHGPRLVGEPEPTPPGCDGAWRVLLVPAARAYDQLVQSYVLNAYPYLLPTLDAALAGSKELPDEDKQWAYEELRKLVENQLRAEQDPSLQSALREWLKAFEQRVAEYQRHVGPGDRP